MIARPEDSVRLVRLNPAGRLVSESNDEPAYVGMLRNSGNDRERMFKLRTVFHSQTSVRPKTPILHMSNGCGLPVWEIFAEDQQNLSQFAPESFQEMRPIIANQG